MPERLEKSPVVYLESLSMDKNQNMINGHAKVYETSYDADFNVTDRKLVIDQSFSIPNLSIKNFHELLKLYAENLVLEYFISIGQKNFVYDYQARSFELRDEKNEDSAFVGNMSGYYYITDQEKMEELNHGAK